MENLKVFEKNLCGPNSRRWMGYVSTHTRIWNHRQTVQFVHLQDLHAQIPRAYTCWCFQSSSRYAYRASDTDLPRLVRPVGLQHLAATDLVHSKAVNWVRFLQKRFVFQMEKTQADLAAAHCTDMVLTCQPSRMPVYLFAPCHQWLNMSKTQPLDLDKGFILLENRHESL